MHPCYRATVVLGCGGHIHRPSATMHHLRSISLYDWLRHLFRLTITTDHLPELLIKTESQCLSRPSLVYNRNRQTKHQPPDQSRLLSLAPVFDSQHDSSCRSHYSRPNEDEECANFVSFQPKRLLAELASVSENSLRRILSNVREPCILPVRVSSQDFEVGGCSDEVKIVV